MGAETTTVELKGRNGAMQAIARTNVQLYNQLRRIRCSVEQLALVRRCYDLAVKLYSGYFRADGSPYLSHVTGVASIVAHLGLPSDVVAAACIHSIYTNRDFGSGMRYRATPYRRRVVRNAVGEMVEAYVYRFFELRSTDHRDTRVGLATQLGHPELAQALTEAFDAVGFETVPGILQNKHRHKTLVVPKACRLHASAALNRMLSRAKRKTRALLRAITRVSLPQR